jgi:hypothetical protein
LRSFLNSCGKRNIFVIFSGTQHRPKKVLKKMGLLAKAGEKFIFTATFDEAVAAARV